MACWPVTTHIPDDALSSLVTSHVPCSRSKAFRPRAATSSAELPIPRAVAPPPRADCGRFSRFRADASRAALRSASASAASSAASDSASAAALNLAKPWRHSSLEMTPSPLRSIVSNSVAISSATPRSRHATRSSSSVMVPSELTSIDAKIASAAACADAAPGADAAASIAGPSFATHSARSASVAAVKS